MNEWKKFRINKKNSVWINEKKSERMKNFEWIGMWGKFGISKKKIQTE